MGLSLSLLELLLEQGLSGGSKKGKRGKSPDEGVKVDARPCQKRAAEAEHQEWHGHKGKRDLRDEETGQIVVLLVLGRCSRVCIQKEWPDLASKV